MSGYSIPLGNSVKDARKKIDLSQKNLPPQKATFSAVNVRIYVTYKKQANTLIYSWVLALSQCVWLLPL